MTKKKPAPEKSGAGFVWLMKVGLSRTSRKCPANFRKIGFFGRAWKFLLCLVFEHRNRQNRCTATVSRAFDGGHRNTGQYILRHFITQKNTFEFCSLHQINIIRTCSPSGTGSGLLFIWTISAHRKSGPCQFGGGRFQYLHFPFYIIKKLLQIPFRTFKYRCYFVNGNRFEHTVTHTV